MPYRRRYAKKSPYKKSNNRYKKRYSTPRKSLQAPTPNIRLAKLRYTEAIDVSAISDVRVFSVNGLYDPYITGIGHQPRGFDQYMAFYSEYVVIGSKITIKGCNDTATESVVLAISVEQSPTAKTTRQDYLETHDVISRVVSSRDASGIFTLSKGCSLKKKLGVNSMKDHTDGAGNESANPVEQQYFHIYFNASDNSTLCYVKYDVTIDYIVLFREPKAIAAS